MKVLSLTEPCATLIKEKKKLIETRSWKTSYRGELYIHASSTRIPKEWREDKEFMELVKDIDYICPVLRSGAVPAIYISNRLNIIKFAPIQVKHIAYKNGENKIEMIFNPFNSIEINKKEPVFLVVEAMFKAK